MHHPIALTGQSCDIPLYNKKCIVFNNNGELFLVSNHDQKEKEHTSQSFSKNAACLNAISCVLNNKPTEAHVEEFKYIVSNKSERKQSMARFMDLTGSVFDNREFLLLGNRSVVDASKIAHLLQEVNMKVFFDGFS